MPWKFCVVCDRKLSSLKLLKYHLNIHKGYYAYICPQCDQIFFTKPGAQKHKMLHRKLEDSDVTLSHRDRRNYKRNHDNLFVCSECGEIYYTQKLLCKHAEKHLKPISYQCDICSKTFASQDSLSGHRGMHKGRRKFYERKQLNRKLHLQSIKDSPLNMNETEKKTVSRSKSLSSDTSTTIPYTCALCKREFSSLDKFCRHEKIHLCSPHHCLACKLTFRTNIQLQSHIRRCEGREISKRDVQQCTSKPIWHCDICGREFDSVPVLKKHRERHKEKKPYKCRKCRRAFLFVEEKFAHAKCHLTSSSRANRKS